MTVRLDRHVVDVLVHTHTHTNTESDVSWTKCCMYCPWMYPRIERGSRVWITITLNKAYQIHAMVSILYFTRMYRVQSENCNKNVYRVVL